MAEQQQQGASTMQIGCGVAIGLVLFFFVFPMAMCGGCLTCGSLKIAEREARMAASRDAGAVAAEPMKAATKALAKPPVRATRPAAKTPAAKTSTTPRRTK